MQPYLLRNTENERSAKIDEYERIGGYAAMKRALSLRPEEIRQEVETANLLGRGGAGFPVSKKWSFAAADPKQPKFLVCNADEGEPGTFKDRPIMEKNPHLLIEGMVISAYAIGAEYGYIYLRGEYPGAYDILLDSISQAIAKGYLGQNIMGSGFNFSLVVHKGAGAYICGEETALLESLEGKRGNPRIRPPYPVNKGYLAMPTVVNNVETFGNIPLIIDIGGSEYAKIGTPESPGPKLFSISGHVNKPGVIEVPMGTTLREIIYEHCEGIRGGRELKAVIPGGLSTSMLMPHEIDCKMDFHTVPKYGSMLGSGAIIVFDETTCMVRMAERAMFFFMEESCGKCTPCREGTGWQFTVCNQIEHGTGREGDIELLVEISDNMVGNSFCALGDSSGMVMKSFIENFRDEFSQHIKESRCPFK